LAAGIVALLAAASARQATLWRDSETLFTHTLAVTGDNPLIQATLGNIRYDQQRYAEAGEHYRAALRALPGQPGFHVNLGNALAALGRDEEALEHYREAARLRPGYAPAQVNLDRALQRASRAAAAGTEATPPER
jgi:tetratricopeptide (TPR) repeat protein